MGRARSDRNEEKTTRRLNINISSRLYDPAQEESSEDGITLAGYTREALAIYRVLREAAKKGKSLYFSTEEGYERIVIPSLETLKP